MLSQTRNSSRLRSSAAKKIQKRFRGKQTRKQVTKLKAIIQEKQTRKQLKATRKIQSRVRGKQTRTKLINNRCSICLEPMIHNVSITSPCGHKFHSDCIRRSLTVMRGTCPLCRTVVTNIPYPSIERQIQPQPPLPPPPNILDPIRRRQLLDLEPLQLIQYLIVRNQELDVIEQSIERLLQLLPDPPEIPNITYEQALVNQVTAVNTETTLRSLYSEAYTIYTNYESFNTQDRPSTNDEIAEQHINAVFNRTVNLLEVAIYDANNALRISNRLGELARGA
jgi:hypothetical protein